MHQISRPYPKLEEAWTSVSGHYHAVAGGGRLDAAASNALLEAVAKVGTTNNHKVIAELEKLVIPAKARMQHHDAKMNAATHQMQQTVYLATANDSATEKDDMFKILTQSAPDSVADAANDAKCKLEPMDKTPVYEP